MLKQYGHDGERDEKMAQSYTALTTGRVPGQLIRYAVPVVLTSLMQALYNLVDMLIVSRMLGPAGASAVNNSSQAMLVLTQIAIGLSNGGNVLIGQYFGAGDERRRQETTGSFFSLFALLGLLFSVLACAFSRSVLVFMGAPALEEAAAYLGISTLGLFFIFGYNALASALRAVGNSRAPMRFVMISTGLNVLLDLLFVGPFGWGTAGAAAATVFSQGLAFLLALFYLLRAGNLFSFCIQWNAFHKISAAVCPAQDSLYIRHLVVSSVSIRDQIPMKPIQQLPGVLAAPAAGIIEECSLDILTYCTAH